MTAVTEKRVINVHHFPFDHVLEMYGKVSEYK